MENFGKTISIIGTGRLGGALAIALSESGFEIENLVARNLETALKIQNKVSKNAKILTPAETGKISSEIILICTQDFEIKRTAENLAENLSREAFVFHTSGSLSSKVLEKLNHSETGSIHPLVSISDPILGAKRFKGAFFCVEGERSAVDLAKKIVKALGGRSFSIEPEFKALYHASAVTACGHLVALLDIAFEMLSKCGLDEKRAREILLPLIKSTVENLEVQNTAEALTGTFARLDTETFERHLNILEENVSGEALETYLQLGMRSLHLVKKRNSNEEKLKEMRGKIALAKKKLKC